MGSRTSEEMLSYGSAPGWPTTAEGWSVGGVAGLVRAAACGHKPAWDHLVDRFAPVVWSTARSYGLETDEAAEVSRATWLRLLENLGRIEHPDQVGSWLTATARQESLRALRLSGRRFEPRF